LPRAPRARKPERHADDRDVAVGFRFRHENSSAVAC
jgi:hypothetical protein